MKNKKNNWEKIYAIIAIIVVIVLLATIIKFGTITGKENGIDRTKCPHGVEGNINATFVIKYVDSPYCVWCWFEEPVLKMAIETKGDLFKLERYDIRYCDDIVKKYSFSGTPSFVFSMDNGTKEYPHTGYINDESFLRIICGATGDC